MYCDAAVGRPQELKLAADQLGAFAHAHQAHAALRLRRFSLHCHSPAAILDFEDDSGVGAGQPDPRLAGAGMTVDVAQRLLGNAVDVNRALVVDDSWLERATEIDFCGKRVAILAIEDLIASKMYVAARDRFDGADILHLVLRRQGRVDWERVVERMGENRELVLWHLLLFDWVYPDHRDLLPAELMARLVDEARAGWGRSSGHDPPTSRGTLLDPVAFSIDTRDWGLRDGRPPGRPVEPRERP